VLYKRGTQRILFCDLEVAAQAIVWPYSHKKENGYSSAASTGSCVVCRNKFIHYSATKLLGSVQGDILDKKTIKAWFDNFLVTGSVLK
jgi:hypothetical protein